MRLPVSDGASRITAALEGGKQSRGIALATFLTAGFPDRASFCDLIECVADESDVVEVGVPFSDPVADGVTIQESSRTALEGGATLRWIFDSLAGLRRSRGTPFILMSYLNPLLAFGIDSLPEAMFAAGLDGLIVPDLPLEECSAVSAALAPRGQALIQMIAPCTPPARVEKLSAASQGFVYAITQHGTTGGSVESSAAQLRYLEAVSKASRLPVVAGFGIRTAGQVAALVGRINGVVVGSALVEVLARREDPVVFLRSLRPGTVAD